MSAVQTSTSTPGSRSLRRFTNFLCFQKSDLLFFSYFLLLFLHMELFGDLSRAEMPPLVFILRRRLRRTDGTCPCYFSYFSHVLLLLRNENRFILFCILYYLDNYERSVLHMVYSALDCRCDHRVIFPGLPLCILLCVSHHIPKLHSFFIHNFINIICHMTSSLAFDVHVVNIIFYM